MSRKAVLGLAVLAFAPAADARQPLAAGSWQRLPAAPAAAAIPFARQAVWTGKQLLVFGRAGTPGAMRNVAFSYTPATQRWRALSPPRGPTGSYEGAANAVWTGRQMLVWGPPATFLSFTPATGRWRTLPASPLGGAPAGLVVWTGRELLGWGGGCCREASRNGAAYDPARRKWHKLAEAPVGGQQRPVGVWTGGELIVLPGRDPNGNRTRGAAYDPTKDTWRRIASPPQERLGASAVWDGREVLVVGGSGPPDPKTGRAKLVAAPYAYDPATNRWRRLSAMDGGSYGRASAATVWTGKALLLWGGETQAQGRYVLTTHGLSYTTRRRTAGRSSRPRLCCRAWTRPPSGPARPSSSGAATLCSRA